jgi:hypothetical protein
VREEREKNEISRKNPVFFGRWRLPALASPSLLVTIPPCQKYKQKQQPQQRGREKGKNDKAERTKRREKKRK